MTDEQRDALPVFTRYPKEHWLQLSGTNPIERQNLEVKRRSRVACNFPNDRSVERLVGARLIETNEKWTDAEPYIHPDAIEAVMNGSAIGEFLVEVPETAWQARATGQAGPGREHRPRTFDPRHASGAPFETMVRPRSLGALFPARLRNLTRFPGGSND